MQGHPNINKKQSGRKPILPGRTLETLSACVDPPTKYEVERWAKRMGVSVALLGHYYVSQGLARTKRRGRNREKIEIQTWLKSITGRGNASERDDAGEYDVEQIEYPKNPGDGLGNDGPSPTIEVGR